MLYFCISLIAFMYLCIWGPTFQGPNLPGPNLPGPDMPGPTCRGQICRKKSRGAQFAQNRERYIEAKKIRNYVIYETLQIKPTSAEPVPLPPAHMIEFIVSSTKQFWQPRFVEIDTCIALYCYWKGLVTSNSTKYVYQDEFGYLVRGTHRYKNTLLNMSSLIETYCRYVTDWIYIKYCIVGDRSGYQNG